MIMEAETGCPSSSQVVMLNGKVIDGDDSTLEAAGFTDDCLVILERRLAASSGAPRQQQQANPGEMNPDGSAKYPELLLDYLGQGVGVDRLPPVLADAVKKRDVAAMQSALKSLHEATRKRQEEEERFMRLAAEDPMNIEVQQKLEEIIRQKNIEENFEKAMEHNPEAFATVSMLYVDMTVNGVKQPAFIDSGAQMSIMGKTTAEKCGLLRLMDTRFAGKAVGVGTGKILGRVHMAPAEIQGHHIPMSISVMDQDGMDFLFGLDNLKRHQCSIDLQKNVLRFPAMNKGGGDLEMPFLPEHLIPKSGISDLIDEAPPMNEGDGVVANNPPAAPPAAPPAGAPAAPPAAPAAAPTAAHAPASHDQQFPESRIAALMDLGFSREACVEALTAAGGNEDVAASLLFS
jgi:DNA damage-inducible protein 1